jgi:IMP dehydrogenase/GMP reductase
MLGGIGVFAKNSLPGDLLYPVKRAGEKVVVSLLPEKSKPNLQLVIANDKLENIAKAVETNQTKKIIPIVKEYQANVSEATQNLKKVAKADTKDIKEIIQTNKTLEETKQNIEKTYAVLLGENKDLNEEIDRLECQNLIEGLNGFNFSQSQQIIFNQLKEDFKNKNYREITEKIGLLLQALENNKEE